MVHVLVLFAFVLLCCIPCLHTATLKPQCFKENEFEITYKCLPPDDNRVPPCIPGRHLKVPESTCSPNDVKAGDEICIPCEEGTYMPVYNSCDRCINKTTCRSDEEVYSEGSLFEDRKCRCRLASQPTATVTPSLCPSCKFSCPECPTLNPDTMPPTSSTHREPDSTNATDVPEPGSWQGTCEEDKWKTVAIVQWVFIVILILIIVIICVKFRAANQKGVNQNGVPDGDEPRHHYENFPLNDRAPCCRGLPEAEIVNEQGVNRNEVPDDDVEQRNGGEDVLLDKIPASNRCPQGAGIANNQNGLPGGNVKQNNDSVIRQDEMPASNRGTPEAGRGNNQQGGNQNGSPGGSLELNNDTVIPRDEMPASNRGTPEAGRGNNQQGGNRNGSPGGSLEQNNDTVIPRDEMPASNRGTPEAGRGNNQQGGNQNGSSGGSLELNNDTVIPQDEMPASNRGTPEAGRGNNQQGGNQNGSPGGSLELNNSDTVSPPDERVGSLSSTQDAGASHKASEGNGESTPLLSGPSSPNQDVTNGTDDDIKHAKVKSKFKKDYTGGDTPSAQPLLGDTSALDSIQNGSPVNVFQQTPSTSNADSASLSTDDQPTAPGPSLEVLKAYAKPGSQGDIVTDCSEEHIDFVAENINIGTADKFYRKLGIPDRVIQEKKYDAKNKSDSVREQIRDVLVKGFYSKSQDVSISKLFKALEESENMQVVRKFRRIYEVH